MVIIAKGANERRNSRYADCSNIFTFQPRRSELRRSDPRIDQIVKSARHGSPPHQLHARLLRYRGFPKSRQRAVLPIAVNRNRARPLPVRSPNPFLSVSALQKNRQGYLVFHFLSKFSTSRPGRFGFLTEPDLLKKT